MSGVLAGVAFEDLYREHVGSLARYITRRVVDDVVEDLVQDVWVRALEHADRFTGDAGDIRAWLTGHAACAVRCHLWSARSQLRAGYALRLEREPLPSPAGDLTGGDLAGDLAVALSRLPAEERRAVQLRCLDGVGSSAAAELLGVSPETVRRRQGRALARLRTALRPVGAVA